MTKRILWLFWLCCFVALGCSGGPSPKGAKHPSGAGSADAASSAEQQQGAPLVMASNPATGKSEAQFMAYTEPGDIPHLELAGEPTKKLPLEHTHVKAKLTGFVAEVEVAQTYTNPYSTPIEAVYIFPLPENSAVNHMRMVIGKRSIEADVMERQAARRTYEEAKSSGHTAALLEQERPNVFTQSVANIEPGKKIDVVVRYVQNLTYDDGQYEFVFPMVVGPRFMPGAPLDGPQSGKGTHADTNRVPDASRISPPIVGKGNRTGHDISLELVADASLAIGAFETPTHKIVARKPADGTLRLSLAEAKSIPNRDFVLRYRVAGAKPKATMYTAPAQGGGGYFSMVLHPPKLDVEQLVGRREIIFVVDISGSMSGKPLSMCKSAMRESLRKLRPVDTFNIITFAGRSMQAFGQPVPANDANVRQALQVVEGLSAGGGTHMADAVGAALSPKVAKGRHRYVFFLTDGYVGNEDEIIAAASRFVAALEKKKQRARVFGFGVGSSTNRHLLDGLSRAGKGVTVYSTTREDPARAVNQFYRYIDRTTLTELAFRWGGLKVTEIYPQVMPDLFASHPVILHGRYQGTPGKVSVKGKAGQQSVVVPVDIRPARVDGEPTKVMGALWARAKVTDLEEQLWDSRDRDGIRTQVLELGLAHDLVTRYTSLVAVDRTRKVGDGKPTTVIQPVEEPEGVDVDMAGGVRLQSRTSAMGPTGARAGVGQGFGSGHGRLGGSHKARKPKVRMGAASVARPAIKAAPPPARPAAAPPPSPSPMPPGSAAGGYGYSGSAAQDSAEEADEAALPEAAPEPPPAYRPTEEGGEAELATEDGAAPEDSDSAMAHEAGAPVEPKRGCGCRVPGLSGGVPATGGMLLAALGVALLLARRRR